MSVKIAADIKDHELSLLLKEGSKDAFRLLYDRYGTRILHFARGYLKHDQDSEELVQDVFLKLWDKRGVLNNSGSIKAFIYKIAVNSIYDFIRRKNIEQAFLEFNKGTSFQTDHTWDEVVFHDMLSNISRLTEKMPEEQRKIFVMSREKGFTNEQISQTLGLSKRTVENQLYRATSFLKKNLELESFLASLFFYLFC